jgi:hypothetical protein
MQRNKPNNLRQSEVDRRQYTLKTFMLSSYRKRRVTARRNEDQEAGYYVDCHEPFVVAISLGILLLCVADTFFTMIIINNGGRELNPFMNMFIEKDYKIFFFIKYALTAIGLLIVIAHNRFRIFKFLYGYHILFAFLFIYSLLVSYELAILQQHLKLF